LVNHVFSTQDDDLTRPLLIGYVQRQLLVTDEQVEGVKRLFATFARVEGYSMGLTYVEHPGGWPEGFEGLIDVILRYQVTAVVLPSLLHFAVLDASVDFRRHFESATGARVLVPPLPAGTAR
jgi:hypothetical protein